VVIHKELWGTSRYCSILYLVAICAKCLENCIDAKTQNRFEDITSGEYLYERLVDLGLIKKNNSLILLLVIKDIEFAICFSLITIELMNSVAKLNQYKIQDHPLKSCVIHHAF
jgi:hypothetical protein